MTPQPNQLWNLSGTLFELLEAREEALANVQRAINGPGGCSSRDDGTLSPLQESEAELEAIETGLRQFVAQQLRDVDWLRAPLKALEQGVAINKQDAAAATNRAMILQNRYDRLKDLIKQCMVALDQAGEWKPKESRKFESARGSFTLRGNGGAQPVDITDEALVPDEYCRVIVTVNAAVWRDFLTVLSKAPGIDLTHIDNLRKEPRREVSKSAIAEALAQPCPHCGGITVDPDGVTPYHCVECGGSGKQGVPGARLAPRGESVIIK
jgi:hypothetical protein